MRPKKSYLKTNLLVIVKAMAKQDESDTAEREHVN